MANPWLILAGVAAGLAVVGAASGARKRPVPPSDRFLDAAGQRVFVHVPAGMVDDGHPRVVLYFHGNGASIDALSKTLPKSIDRATRKAILVVPQLPADGSAGRLGDVAGVRRLLETIFRAIDLRGPVERAHLVFLVHSGGYLGAGRVLDHGERGVDLPPPESVGLLDALYGSIDVFERFATRGSSRHFGNVYGPSTEGNSVGLAGRLATKLGARATFDSKGTIAPAELAELFAHKAAATKSLALHADVPDRYAAAMIDAFYA